MFCSPLASSPAHFTWNHSWPFRVPHPHDMMETSKVSLTLFTTDIIVVPFHASQYWYYHSISDPPAGTKKLPCLCCWMQLACAPMDNWACLVDSWFHASDDTLPTWRPTLYRPLSLGAPLLTLIWPESNLFTCVINTFRMCWIRYLQHLGLSPPQRQKKWNLTEHVSK